MKHNSCSHHDLQHSTHCSPRGVLLLAIGPRRFEGGIQRAKEREYEWLTDVTDTVGSTFLGLTFHCARCHDHKFDALSQSDYFGLQAVFADCQLEEKRIGDKGGDTRPAVLKVVTRNKPGTVQILRRGEIDLPIQEAVASFPVVLMNAGDHSHDPPEGRLPRRAELARWLTSPNHPLTARVLVNRVWQWHFGRGLVRSPNDFGVQGELPTHPDLLDWLASELIDSGWNLNHIHRLILTSATYRSTSVASDTARERDPENRWLSHFPRRRLQAEELRDALLVASGRLNSKPFGPAVVPKVEPWVLASLRNQNWNVTADQNEWRRRSVYLVVRRSMKLPFLDAFNGPDTISSCAGRESSVVASQALMMLNDEESWQAARNLAGRLWIGFPTDRSNMIVRAWQLVFGRKPTLQELARANQFLEERERSWKRQPPPAQLLPHIENNDPPPAALGAALVEWSLMLFNANEFAYVD